MTTPSSQLSFQLAEPENLEYLVAKTLALHHFETQDAKTNQYLSDDFEQQIKDWLKSELELNNTLVFLIFQQEQTIGFAHIKVLPSPNKFTQFNTYGYIQSLWLEPECRGKSLGKPIVSFIESVFKEQQVGYYEVNTSANNQLAQGFWKSIGMEAHSMSYRKML